MNDKTEMPQEAARPKRKFGPSTVARLQVARVSEMGAFLDAQTGNTSDDILLHKTHHFFIQRFDLILCTFGTL